MSGPRDPVRTERLVLTPIERGDVADLLVLYADPQVAHWTGPWTTTAVEDWTTGMVERWACDGVGKWIARSRADGSLVGRGGFSLVDLDGEQVLELGWVVRDHLTGQGYATDLGRAALDWANAFRPELSIVSFTEVHNHASQAVMRRLGLQPAGVIHREGLIEGRPGLHPYAPFALHRLTSERARSADTQQHRNIREPDCHP